MRRWPALSALLLVLLTGFASCDRLSGRAAPPEPASPLAAEAIAVSPLGTESVETTPEPPAAPVASSPAIKSAGELACERRQGRYVAVGGARTCVTPTSDGGKQCRGKGDCSGQCLARSNSCAPVAPLLGCNEILQSNGRRVTLCLD
ncbi:MAG: hypothetical protein V7668_21240 [Cereibacter changlensis]